MEKLDCFQVYSYSDGVNILVDKIWIKEDRIYFRVLKKIYNYHKHFRKESESNVYSIPANSLYSIRCKLYF
ncbi:MAG: hypothetical protein EU532_01720 [Promethearchaeota archaeon]|nr:MAG: hypothetical protein EU532_01720 [Candidatus Lokiarchaeota archaeon]